MINDEINQLNNQLCVTTLRTTKGGDTCTIDSYESLIRVHDTRSRGESDVIK